MQHILDKSKHWIQFPSNKEALNIAKRNLQEKYDFPVCLGALECIHIPIEKLFVHGDSMQTEKNVVSKM